MIENTHTITSPSRLRFIGGVVYTAFRALVGAYALSVLLGLPLHFFFDETTSDVVAFTNSVIHFTTLGAVVLLPLCLILRRWELVLMLLPSALVWCIWFIPSFLPKPIPNIPPDATHFTVLSFNLLAPYNHADETVKIVGDVDADIVAIQELSDNTAQALITALAEDYPYRELHPGGIPGMGIFSRYPLSECIRWRVMRLYHQRCILTIAETSIAFYNVHPMSPLTPDGFNQRQLDIESILARVDADRRAGLPVLIAGDWNMTDKSGAYAQVTQTLTDAYAMVGQGLGWTYRLHLFGFIRELGGIPVARIDYIFYTVPFIALRAQVWGEFAGSDHMPLLVELALP